MLEVSGNYHRDHSFGPRPHLQEDQCELLTLVHSISSMHCGVVDVVRWHHHTVDKNHNHAVPLSAVHSIHQSVNCHATKFRDSSLITQQDQGGLDGPTGGLVERRKHTACRDYSDRLIHRAWVLDIELKITRPPSYHIWESKTVT